MMRIIINTIAFIILFSSPFYAQNKKVEILVKDAVTGEALPYCHIQITKGGKPINYCLTDINGKTEIEYQAKSILKCSFLAYETKTDSLYSYRKKLIFRLKPERLSLKEVLVTGQNKPIKADQSIYDIKLISKETIEQQAAVNLSDLLQRESNLQITNDPSTGSSVKMQGMTGENVKILVDGVPIIGRMNGNIDLSQIKLNQVDHIEIVEGPMSVMYGSNALAGLINIITKEHKTEKIRANLDTYYETVGTYNVDGEVYYNGKSHALGANFGRHFFAGYNADKNQRQQAWKPKEQYSAGLYYQYHKALWKIKYKLDVFKETLLDRNNLTPPYFNKGNDVWFRTYRINNNLRIKYDFSENSSFDVLAAYSLYYRTKEKYLKNLNTLETVLSPNEKDHDTTRFDALILRGVYNKELADNKLHLQSGFDLNYEYSLGKRIKDETQDMGDYAWFTSLQWQFLDNWSVQPAVRLAYNSKYKAPVTPSLNIKYDRNKTNVRLSYARGFRAPSLKELYLYFYDSNHQIEGNDLLKAEYSHNVNASVNQKIDWGVKDLSIKLNTYYNHINNRITLIQVDPNNSLHFRNQNIGEFKSVGANLSAHLSPFNRAQLDLGFSYTGVNDELSPDKSFRFNTNLHINIRYKFWKRTASVGLNYNYTGPYPQYYYKNEEVLLGHIKAYHNLDLNVSKKLFKNKLRLSFGLKNIFDNVTISGMSGASGTAHSSGSNYLVGWGRTFYFSLKYSFYKY